MFIINGLQSFSPTLSMNFVIDPSKPNTLPTVLGLIPSFLIAYDWESWLKAIGSLFVISNIEGKVLIFGINL